MFPFSPYGYMPIPQGTDPEKLLKLLERIQKKNEKKKPEEKKEEPIYDPKTGKLLKPQKYSFVEMMGFLCFLGIPVGMAELGLLYALKEMLKTIAGN